MSRCARSSISTDGEPSIYLIEPPMPEEESHHQIVRRQQGQRANQSAGYRIVIAGHRVLDGIGKRKQHDQIKRIELREFSLAEDAQSRDQEKIDDDRTQHLLSHRHRRSQVKHFRRA